MRRWRTRIGSLVIAGLLTACSSTMPQSASSLYPDAPTVTPQQRSQQDGTGSVMPSPSALPGDGPVTSSMEKLKIDGERYAALGDPNAPITVVEFSDYG